MCIEVKIKKEVILSEIMIPGPAGLLQGKMVTVEEQDAPIAFVLHPHPLHGGTMNNKIVHTLFKKFASYDFNVLKINFRGVGKSQGKSFGGYEEIEDALTALDWAIKKSSHSQKKTPKIWVAGFSFGAWVAMQIAMRRPEVVGFVAVSPPVENYSFNMLTPCPSGIILQGSEDQVVDCDAVESLASQLIPQKGSEIVFKKMEADHYFKGKLDELGGHISYYLDSKIL